ncbi:MAG: CCA tRNA nucleotidyltransferase [Candidatus Methanospirareceae archaeon]
MRGRAGIDHKGGEKEEEIKRIIEEVIQRIRPGEEERKKVKAITDHILHRINKKISEDGIEAHAVLVGSAARNTWIRGDEDIDIFILFPEDVPEEVLREKGLEIAKSVADRYEERYASHPYIHAFFYDEEGKEHEADLVPCFAVKDATMIKSAVDRTPFHNEYVAKRIIGKEDEVLLLKQFMKGIGVYGAEQRVMGFSGYLCELLILYYGSFLNTIRKATKWKYGVKIDIEGEGRYKGEEPLIVIDPVDPHRNAAAAVSLLSFSKFIDASRDFLSQPNIHFFFPPKKEAMSREEFLRKIEERGTEIVVIMFDAPEVVDDVLFPQLRKAEVAIRNLIERHDFVVYRSGVSVEEREKGDKRRAFLVFEFLIWKLPKIKKHIGPPVTIEEHAIRFKKKHATSPIFIENGRYTAEIRRKYTDVKELLKKELKSCSLGKHVSEAIKGGYEVLSSAEIPFSESIGYFFSEYFSGNVSYSPLYR